jgi:hypothetical protein
VQEWTGHLETAQLILSLNGVFVILGIANTAFLSACEYGHLEMAQWLLSLNVIIDIHDVANSAFLLPYTHLTHFSE